MSTITRERLREHAREKVKSLEFTITQTAFADSRAELEEELELARIALASLEAEPVAWLWSNRKHPSEVTLVRPEDDEKAEGAHWSGWSCQALYAEPTAPVSVPAALPNDIDGDDHPHLWCYNNGWNACRAAMLQSFGNSEQLNSPVIPDGWVACSERMPDIDTEIFYFCKDDGLRDCGIVSSSNFSDSGDAQLYVHAEGYDLRLGVDITHWMPLPAAPQQEVK